MLPGEARGTVTIDPVAATLLSTKLPNGQYLIPSAQSNAPYNPNVPNGYLIGTSRLRTDQATISLDYDATKRDRVETKYFFQNAPVTRPFGFSNTAGFPVTAAQWRAGLFAWQHHCGQSEIQLGAASRIRAQWDLQQLSRRRSPAAIWASRPRSPTTWSPMSCLDCRSTTLPTTTSTHLVCIWALPECPALSWIWAITRSRVNPSTNVIFTAGKHTIVAGGGYSYTQLNITNNRTGHAQVIVNGFDNFLQGAVHSSSVVESIDPTTKRNNADRYYRTNEFSSYVQDKWQVLTNLSITAGVRYDYHGGMTEKYGDMFNFDPTLYNVTGTTTTGFDVVNAGFVIAGNNKQNPTKGVSASTLNGRQWGISPRLGFAWSPKSFNSKLVISGGGGIYYDRGELFTYLSQPAGSSIGGPFGVTESSPLVSLANGNSDSGLTLGEPDGGLSVLAGSGGQLCSAKLKPGCYYAGIAVPVKRDDGGTHFGLLQAIRQKLQRPASTGRIFPLHDAAELRHL